MPGSVKSLRLHNLLIANAITGAQLDTELADAFSKGAYERSLGQRSVAAAFKKSAAALTINSLSVLGLEAICNQDTTIFDALLLNQTAAANVGGTLAPLQKIADYPAELTKLLNNSSAMTALAASASGVNEIIADSTLRTGVSGNANAITVLTNNTTAWNTLCNSSAWRTSFAPSVNSPGFGTIQNNAVACAKYMAGVLGIDAATITAASQIMNDSANAAAVCANATARSVLWHSDALQSAITSTTRTMIRSSASYSQLTDTKNGTPDLESVAGGSGNLLVIGLRVSSSAYTLTLATLRSNSAKSVSYSVGTALNDTICVPVTWLSYSLNNTSSYTFYFDTLAC